jgi:hypothetical protein
VWVVVAASDGVSLFDFFQGIGCSGRVRILGVGFGLLVCTNVFTSLLVRCR